MTIVVSLFTKKKPEAELAGLVKGLTPAVAGPPVPLLKRPGFWAILSLVILAALNIWFW